MTSSKSQPDLRFPEFKSDWEEIRVGPYIDEFRGRSRDHDEYPVLTSSNRGLMIQEEYYGQNRITEKDNAGFNIIPPGYITYRSRSDNRTFTFNINDLGITGLISIYYPVFSIKNGSNRFFVEYFNSRQHYLGKYSVGTSQQVLSLNELREIKLRIPEQAEQHKIAAFLSAVDEKIGQLIRKKRLLLKYKKGVTQQIFNQKIRFKDDNGNEFPDWRTTTLGEISQNVMYGMNSAAAPYDGENGYIRITDIDEEGQFVPSPMTTPSGNLDDRYRVRTGDILFARTGATVGKSYYYSESDGRLFFAGFLIRFSIIEGNPFFIYLQTQIHSYDKWVQKISMRSGQPGINAEEFKSLEIRLPCFPEQNKIANFVLSLNKKINMVDRRLKIAEAFKKALLQQMFV